MMRHNANLLRIRLKLWISAINKLGIQIGQKCPQSATPPDKRQRGGRGRSKSARRFCCLWLMKDEFARTVCSGNECFAAMNQIQ
jgi:hypothetical protein